MARKALATVVCAGIAGRAVVAQAQASQTCVRNEDCSRNPWCADPAYITWCPNQGSHCPEPMCTWTPTQASTTTGVQTTTTTRATTAAGTTASTRASTLATTQATTRTTAPATAPATTTAPAATSAGSSTCRRNSDCAANPWCADPAYDAWCAAQGPAACPSPMCVGSTAGTTAAGTPGTTASPTASPQTSFLARSTTAVTATATTTATTATAPSGQCGPGSAGLAAWFTAETFASFFPNINNPACTGANFFSWCALVQAAAAFPEFCNSGDTARDKLELAAFLAQTSHETTGGWPTAPGGPEAWGYCFKEEVGCGSGACTGYCAAGNPCVDLGFDCTCAAGQTYHGRGPIQLSWNYNYGPFSREFLGDASALLRDPSRLTRDPVLAYQSAIWFWMTPQSRKPSCHDVITGRWTPSSGDLALGRAPGFGMTTNIINGGLECGFPTNDKVRSRVAFFKRYLGLLPVPVPADSTLYCNSMVSYR